jgi:putative transcriptional regulator
MIRILLSTRLGERRWTQAKLAQKTGVRKATINEIYNELTDKVRLSDLDKICWVLECDLTDLLVRDGSDPFEDHAGKV